MTERYWVYVNHPNNKAIVHEAACSHCNDGRGMVDDKSRWNGEWRGPFRDASVALKKANESGKRNIRLCGHCARRTENS